ncbi:hypothetical protein NQ315_015545, partial [Exocentrus adspersus]
VHQMYRDQIMKKTPKTVGEWSTWSPWSPCSRSCGGGVTQQIRHCINRPADPSQQKPPDLSEDKDDGVRVANLLVAVLDSIKEFIYVIVSDARIMCKRYSENNFSIKAYWKLKDCPGTDDFRHQQCAAFNHRLFKGRQYYWEPFLKVKDECALNCRAVGMSFFATLNKTVIDGTSCLHPITSTGKSAPKGTRGICIDGYCKVSPFLLKK